MILILAQAFPPQLGGIEQLMSGLASALVALGHEVRVHADTVEGARRYDATAPFAIRRFHGPLAWRRRVMAWAAADEIARLKPAAIFVTSWKGVEHLSVAAPLAVLAHGNDVLAGAGSFKAQRIGRALRKARVVIANSAYTGDLARTLAPAGADVRVVHPGVERLAPPTEAARLALAQRVGDGPLVVSLARLEPRKGIDRSIEAFASLAGRYPTLKYAIAGEGGDAARLQGLVNAAGLRERVIFLGPVSGGERSALLARTHIFLLPTRLERDSVEGYGLVYREAAQFGAPSIAGAVGGARDAVADGETGLVVDGENVASIAAALTRLLDDEGLRARMGELARVRVCEDGLWPQAAQRYLEALNMASASGAPQA